MTNYSAATRAIHRHRSADARLPEPCGLTVSLLTRPPTPEGDDVFELPGGRIPIKFPAPRAVDRTMWSSEPVSFQFEGLGQLPNFIVGIFLPDGSLLSYGRLAGPFECRDGVIYFSQGAITISLDGA